MRVGSAVCVTEVEDAMKKAAIVYQSKTGTTRAFAEAISRFLNGRGVEAKAWSISDADLQAIADADYVLLGCWTSGLLILLQHPDEPWTTFARDLPSLRAEKVGLFTTYKVATGGMFRKMGACLAGKTTRLGFRLKSRGKKLSKQHEEALDRFLE